MDDKSIDRATQSRVPLNSAMSRFEVVAALLLGLLLPGLETSRRGLDYWWVNFTTMFEDYVAGAALLTAAAGAWCQRRWADSWMIISWSGISFMMFISTVSQIEKQLRGNLEPSSGLVLGIKLLLLLASGYALSCSLRRRATCLKPE